MRLGKTLRNPILCGAIAIVLTAVAAQLGVAKPFTAPDATPSHVTISVLRWADLWGNAPYSVVTRLWLADETVQQVSLKVVYQTEWGPGTLWMYLSRRSAHEWEANANNPDLNEMMQYLTGAWSIEIIGPNPSVTEFLLDLSGVEAAALYATPDITSPTAYATDVPPTVQFVWTNPAAPNLPDQLTLYEYSNNGCGPGILQQLDSADGGIRVSATTWQPSAPIGTGWNEFRVNYSRFSTSPEASIGPMVVTEGSIRWASPPGAPINHPPGTPLVLLGSQRMITFEVANPVPLTGDLNGDGAVNGLDLAIVLGNWTG